MGDWTLGLNDGQYVSSTITGDGGANYGIQLTSSGSSNNKGNWFELKNPLPFDVSGFWFGTTFNNTANAKFAVDVGVGQVGSEVVILPNFFISTPRAIEIGAGTWWPLRIPKGSRVVARLQSSTASGTCEVSAHFVSSGFSADSGFSRVTDYGTTMTPGVNTEGAQLDPGGTANTKGSWQTLTSSTNRIKAITIIGTQFNTATSDAAFRVDIGTGATPLVVMENIVVRSSATNDQLVQKIIGPIPLSIPAGVALKARCQCSITNATDRLIDDFVVYGFD